jgi:hypothetical protein
MEKKRISIRRDPYPRTDPDGSDRARASSVELRAAFPRSVTRTPRRRSRGTPSGGSAGERERPFLDSLRTSRPRTRGYASVRSRVGSLRDRARSSHERTRPSVETGWLHPGFQASLDSGSEIGVRQRGVVCGPRSQPPCRVGGCGQAARTSLGQPRDAACRPGSPLPDCNRSR